MKDDLKINPLSEENVERIQEELTAEFERQEDLQTERARRIAECDPQSLLPRIESLEKNTQKSAINMHKTIVALGERVEALEGWKAFAEKIMIKQNDNMNRIIAVLDNMKIQS